MVTLYQGMNALFLIVFLPSTSPYAVGEYRDAYNPHDRCSLESAYNPRPLVALIKPLRQRRQAVKLARGAEVIP